MGSFFSCLKENQVKIPEKRNQSLKCICILDISKEIYSGFFIKFKSLEKQDFICIATKNTTIPLNKNSKIKIIYGYNFQTEIDLNDNRYILNLSDKNYEIVLIEIIPKDKIEESYYLIPDLNYQSNINELTNKEIELIEQNSEKVSNYATGKIESIDDNELIFFSNYANFYPGSPIFIKEHNEVLAIIKKGNTAYLLQDILNILKTELRKKTIKLDDGGEYYGEIDENNKPNGKGKYTFNNGESYEGDIIDDKFEGTGKYIYSNGEYYIGLFKSGLRQGEGILYYPNGNIKYKGNFVNDKYEGDGKYIWENGDYYEGKFKEGLNEGEGKEYYSNGKLKYEGNFVNDNYEGKGKYFYEEGDYYEGDFKEGLKHGKGIMYYKNGNIQYEGDFVKGKFEGKGKYIFENGDYYEGEFKNDMSHGKGKECDINGNVINEGEWIDDVFQKK